MIELIISLYAGGMTVRDIQAHIAECMKVDISHETFSKVTFAVLEDVYEWQHRELDEFFPGDLPGCAANQRSWVVAA